MALSEFDRKYLTDAQQKAVIEATADWNAAKKKGDQAGMDAAAKRAAAVRAQAGYSGGKDGTGYTALGNGGKPKVVNDLSPLAVERADERDKSNAASATRQAAQTAPEQTAQPNLTQRLVNIITGAAKSTGAGVVNALGVLSDVSDSYEAAKKNMGVTTHADEERATMYPNAQSGQRSTAELYDTADRLQQQSAQNIGAAKQGLGKVGSTIVDVGVAGTQLLGDAAVNLVAPGAGLAALGTRAFGNASQEARQKGATLAQQIGYGAAVGGIEVLTEKMFNGLAGIYGKGTADEVVEV